MSDSVSYTAGERVALWTIAVATLAGINGVFLYGTFVRPELLREALANPVALAFIVEALLLVALLAYFLDRWGVGQLSAGAFVLLSLVGGLAFALPVAMLWRRRGAAAAAATTAGPGSPS